MKYVLHVELNTGETYTHGPTEDSPEILSETVGIQGDNNKWVYYPLTSVKFFVVTEVDE